MGPDELRMASLLGVVADVSSLLGLNLTASSIGGANMPPYAILTWIMCEAMMGRNILTVILSSKSIHAAVSGVQKLSLLPLCFSSINMGWKTSLFASLYRDLIHSISSCKYIAKGKYDITTCRHLATKHALTSHKIILRKELAQQQHQ
eukprot:scaffold196_cov225-Chaetoceros_neogracile.AAC.18